MLLDGGRVGVEGNLLSYFFYLQSKVSRAKYVIKKPPPPRRGTDGPTQERSCNCQLPVEHAHCHSQLPPGYC